jgi:thiamine-monophosphate kinase
VTRNEDPGEREILRTLRAMAARTARKAVRVGIGDDCAVLTPRRGEELVITTDFSIEDRHFRHDWHPPEAVGYKCLARGLSDIAAMGARPIAAFVSLAVPRVLTQPFKRVPRVSRLRPGKSQSWIARFYAGLLTLAEREHVTLAGGDLSESPSLAFADVIVIGAAPRRHALLRSGARAGDVLYVTGKLGGAAAELAALEVKPFKPASLRDDHRAHPHFYPQPRISTGEALVRGRLASACIDISDGLSTDLLHLCEESNLEAELDASAIPLAVWNGSKVTIEQALHGGDDYELLFTAAPGTRIPRRLGGVAISAIGRMVPRKRGARIAMLTAVAAGKSKKIRLDPKGWQHF